MKRPGGHDWLMTLIILTLTACGGRIYPVTSGFHAPGETFGLGHDINGRFIPSKPETVVIWAQNTHVEYHLAGALLRDGYTVVERARLQQIFAEQKMGLLHASDSEEDLLRVGRIAGATQVVFAEVHREPPVGPEAKSVTASIRGVSVETGHVRWSGTASVSSPGSLVIHDTQEGSLVELAMRRATCPVEIDFEWIEASDSDYVGGCRQRSRK